MKSLLLQYAAYNVWANKRIISILETCSAEQIDRRITSSFPSLRKTAYHIWGAEDVWFQRLNGNSPDRLEIMDFDGMLSAALDNWLKTSKAIHKSVGENDKQWLSENCTYSKLNGEQFRHPRHWMVHHCMNHSTYHRGQLVTMLRQVGISDMPATDFIAYIRTI